MPELPEVETIVRDLEPLIVGQTIDQILVLKEKSFIGDWRQLVGEKIVAISRAGKMIMLKLSEQKFFAIHLKMTGQLIWQKFQDSSPQWESATFKLRDSVSLCDMIGGHPDIAYQKQTQLPHKYTRVWFLFASGDKLFFNDLRIFGWIKLLSLAELKKEQAKIGFDALGARDNFSEFARFIKRYPNRVIKGFLMDQKIIAGIGNIYASEILFDAKVLPTRKVKSLTKTEQKKVFQSIDNILLKAIKLGGTSSSDYRRPDGSKGGYLDHAFVYAREGERCKKCSAKIMRQKIGQRSAFFCPCCQK